MTLIDRRSVLITGIASVAALRAPALVRRRSQAASPPHPRRHQFSRAANGRVCGCPRPHGDPVQPRPHQSSPLSWNRKLRGDRNGNLLSLQGRKWDAVIDNSGFVPRHVRDSARLLRDSGQYLFTSTVSVYASFSGTSIKETDRLGRLPDPTVERVTGRTYGPLKAYCEAEVRKVFGDRATIVRPGFLVGPRDRTDRWTYWPVRFSLGGEMLSPGSPADPVQFIDVRDVAAWFVRLAEQRIDGTYNATGPASGLSMSACSSRSVRQSAAIPNWYGSITTSCAARGSRSRFGCRRAAPAPHSHRVENRKALAAGLQLRSVALTAADTLKWWSRLSADRRQTMRAGLRATPMLPPGPASFQAVLAEGKVAHRTVAQATLKPLTFPMNGRCQCGRRLFALFGPAQPLRQNCRNLGFKIA